MNFCITTDSGADLPLSYCQTHDITVLPLAFTIEGQTYHGSGAMDDKDFYDKLRAGALPTTSAANPEDTAALFRTFAGQGKDLLHVAFSSGLSSTSDAAQIAAQMVMEEYPQRQVVVVDSMGAGLGTGILTCKAADYSIADMDIRAAEEQLNIDRLGLCEYFTVDDLMFLKRTGRVSGVTAVLGSMLQIKPMLRGNEDGKIVVCGKIRGRKRAITELAEMYAKKVVDAEHQRVAISHGDCLEEAQRLAERIRQIAPPKELILSMHEPLTGAHVGPGMLAVFFFGNGR